MTDRPGGSTAADVLQILMPEARDADSATVLLAGEDVECRICLDVATLCAGIGEDAGAVLVADEALTTDALEVLSHRLETQPGWSIYPLSSLRAKTVSRSGW